jgi:lantibiotic modifying enzyme
LIALDATASDAAGWRLSAATAERELLEAHDIPLFTIDWNATDGHLGPMPIADLVHDTGTATIRERLADTVADRRRLQTDLTRSVLGVRLAVSHARAGGDDAGRTNRDDPPSRHGAAEVDRRDVVASSDATPPSATADACLDVSRSIAEHLERTAVSDDAGGLCWLDIDVSGQFAAPLLTDDGLCAGNVGVAVFSAALAAVSGETGWADLAARTIAGTPSMTDISLYLGSSGRGYGLTLVGALLDDRSIVERGVALLEDLPDAPDADAKPLDLLFGLPGIAGALAAVAITTGDGALAAKSVGYARAVERSWRAASCGSMLERAEAHRIGVAHGITGITLALGRVHQATDDRQIGRLVDEMIERENERIDRRGGIPARLDAVDRSPDRGWCWGAAGYVMARRAIAEITGHPAALHAVDAGLDVVREGRGSIDRLCCGRAAQADALGTSSASLDELVDRPLRWRFEGTETHQNASLLRGVSGVGITLLRAAAPGRLPQPLTLDPMPRHCATAIAPTSVRHDRRSG